MNTPHAVKVFMWRACHNALATKANLLWRKIKEDPLCPLCGVEAETTGHLLWGCLAAKAIWSLCNRNIQKKKKDALRMMNLYALLRSCMINT